MAIKLLGPDPSVSSEAVPKGYADATYVPIAGNISVSGIKTFTGEIVVPTPTNSGDAVTKAYADALSQGLSVKGSCRLGTAAALPANTYLSGVLTGTSNGALTVDGTAVATSDRILVKDEVTQANNGIYTVTATGSAGAVYVLTRSLDMDTGSEVPGAFSFVEAGSTNSGAGFVIAGAGPYTIGTTAIVWTQFSGAGEITAGNGLSKTGNTLSLASSSGGGGLTYTSGVLAVGAGSGITVNADDVALASSVAGTGLTYTSGVLASNASQGDWRPEDHSLAAWTYDPVIASTGSALTSGTIYLVGLQLRVAATVTSIYWHNNSAGTVTSGQNFVGLYNSSGTRLGQSSIAGTTVSVATKTEAIGTQNLGVGLYWVAFLFNGSTMPQPIRLATYSATALNLGLTAATARYATNATGQTSLPTSITPGNNVNAGLSYWVGLG